MNNGHKKFDFITKKVLEDLYLNKNLGTGQIGELLGCNGETVRYRMKKFGIIRRNRLEGCHLIKGRVSPMKGRFHSNDSRQKISQWGLNYHKNPDSSRIQTNLTPESRRIALMNSKIALSDIAKGKRFSKGQARLYRELDKLRILYEKDFKIRNGNKGFGRKHYRLDAFIPSLSVAIEYDEFPTHRGKDLEKDKRKDKFLLDKYGIKVMRIQSQEQINEQLRRLDGKSNSLVRG